VLGDQLRLEGAVPVPGHPDLDLADLGVHLLRRPPVAAVARPAARRVARLITQVLGQLASNAVSSTRRVNPVNKPFGPVNSTPSARARSTS
jgi:hypothetical protein